MGTGAMRGDTEVDCRRDESWATSPYLNRPLRTLAEAEREIQIAESVIIQLALTLKTEE